MSAQVKDSTKTLIPNGIYTIIGPKGYKTFRIETVTEGNMKGMRVLSLFTGSNNEHNYTWFASVHDIGVSLWKPFRNKTEEEIEATVNSHKKELMKHGRVYCELVWQLAIGNQAKFPSYRLEVAPQCLRCNRTLTTPKALEAGIGAECLKKMKGGE